MSRKILAASAAILIQPIVFYIWQFLPEIVIGTATIQNLARVVGATHWVLAVATGFVLLLGIPIFAMLRRLNRLSTGNILVTGFLAGAIPMFILALPVDLHGPGGSYGGNWHGMLVDSMVDGVYTKYAWYIFVDEVLAFGVHGLVGAYVFIQVWHRP